MKPIQLDYLKNARPSRVVWEWAYSNTYELPDRIFHARLDPGWLLPVTAIIEQHHPNEDDETDKLFQAVFLCGALEIRYPMPSGNLESIKKQAADLLYGEYGFNLYTHIYHGMCEGLFTPAQFAVVSDKYQLTRLMEYGTDAAD